MKSIANKSIVVLLIFMLILSSFYGCGQKPGTEKKYDMAKISNEVLNSNIDFSFDLFRALDSEDRGSNVFISPLSVSTALTMTYNGAANDTLADMEKGLRYVGIERQKVNETYENLLAYLTQADRKVELDISNSIWYRQGEPIMDAFITTNRNVFSAEVNEVDFSDPETVNSINSWIKKSTNGKIQEMISPPIPGTIVMYLINAVYFKGQWTTKFKKSETFESDFNGLDGIQKVNMMRRNGEVEYGEGDDFRVVKLPYGNAKIAMYCILPDEEQSITSFVQSLDAEKFSRVKESINTTENVELQIPKFKMEYGIKKLNDPLISMGMVLPFSTDADFSGIREGLYISEVLHKAVIEVNEEGSEAAGATVVVVGETAVQEPVTFIADRPFLFLIEEEETGTILFMGKYCNAL